MNIFACPNLQVLSCERRKLTSLNVKEFVNLKTLNCSGSQLTSLEVSGCSNLNTLDCSYNQLTALYIQGCTSLQELDCRGNKFTQESVNILCSSLPDTYGNLWIDTDKWDTTLAKVKGWTVSNEYY
ncbi:leucine-rich repeat domain-containing protein [Odoribacter splanchnicus]|uniref:leucine-rich repeat domain-containing protein n=1 Tax=Odoribacter splanchnicus TaxID=28118 RepID=UPI0015FB03DC|nr:leucine-rich repeat domain-containing protein [Odoribacter splanchnicus]